jgi:predicted NBD/HSP70 family sugar kinase
MNVLAIDIGGTHVKILATGHDERQEFESGPQLTPQSMVASVKKLAKDWKYELVSIGYPGRVRFNRPLAEPRNLAKGWVGFNFEAAFQRPVRIINDAAMQALGSYRGGTMLFLGLGTGLGSAMVVEGTVVPFELGQLSYKKGTVEDYLGRRGLQRLGKKKWRQEVAYCIGRLVPALQLDDVVLGGGNVKKLKTLPKGCRGGDNVNAFLGGFRLWEDDLLPRAPRKKTLFAVPKKSSPHPNQKTRLTDKDTMKGAAA